MKGKSLSGQLGTMFMGDLFQWLNSGKKTGTLQIDVADCKKTVYFRDGRVLFASSTKDSERLGQFLVRRAILSPLDLTRCLDIWQQQRGIMKLSEIIVGCGYLTNQQMLEKLGEMVEEIVYDLFLYEEGFFEFEERYIPSQVKEAFQLDPQWLVFEGVRRLDEFRRISQELPAIDQVLVKTGVDPSQVRNVPHEALILYNFIDGQRDVEAIYRESPLSKYETQHQMMFLLAGDLITLRVLSPEDALGRRIDRLFLRAVSLLESGDLTEAYNQYSELLKLSPDVKDQPEIRAFEGRLRLATAAELDRLVGSIDTPLRVDVAILRGERFEPLTADEGFILSRIGERATLHEVLQTSGFPRAQAHRLMLSLLNRRIVQKIDTSNQLDTSLRKPS